MSGYRCFVCPVEYNNDTNSFTVDCEPSGLFRLQEYNIPGVIQSIIGWVCATHMGWMTLGWLVTTKREALSPPLPSLKKPSFFPPQSCKPQDGRELLKSIQGEDRKCFLLPQTIKTRVLKVCFWVLGHPEMLWGYLWDHSCFLHNIMTSFAFSFCHHLPWWCKSSGG